MEDIAQPLRCIFAVRLALKGGKSVRSGIENYLSVEKQDFSIDLKRWLFAFDQGQDLAPHRAAQKSIHRRVLIDLLKSGLEGVRVDDRLESLETEIQRMCKLQVQRFLSRLPVKLMIPLLLFQFPAFLILLFGPLLKGFLEFLWL